MRRKTSDVPTVVYKYALRPPTGRADEIDLLFRQSRCYYNQLVTIENVRRRRYRDARARLFPEYARLEAEVAQLTADLEAARTAVKALKAATRSRAVDESAREAISDLASRRKIASESLKTLRDAIAKSDEMEVASRAAGEEATAAVKALRKTAYWGNYQLAEDAVNQASRKSKYGVAYDDTPAHLLRSRIGVQFIGGISPADLVSDTQMQIANPPTFRQTASGKLRASYRDASGELHRCLLRIRTGSDAHRKPVWAEFPLAYHRPLPADSRIMKAQVVRSPLRERNPWQYYLCVTIETHSHERRLPGTRQEGTTSINFGWRLMPTGCLRVATINREGKTPTHVEIPAEILSGHAKCRSLQQILDREFDAVKSTLSAWLSTCDAPEAFRECFEHVSLWKSQHRLCDLAWYWSDHRVAGDDQIYPVVEAWRKKYLHLHDWWKNQLRRLGRWRDDFYWRVGMDLATTSAVLVVDTFKIADVARRPPAEEVEEGGQASRRNRVIAAPSDLRERILKMAAKYHCEVVAAKAADGTRRCNVCGAIEDVSEIVHDCSQCGGRWDQDVNNTDNLHDAHESGAVTTLVSPAGDSPSSRRSYRSARAALSRGLTTEQ